MHTLKGNWFVLDGINAVGKSSQLKRLAQHLEASGLEVLCLSEFSQGPLGQLIDGIIQKRRFYSLHPENKTPFADAHALLADLLYEVELHIQPARKAGKVVLSDRGILSFCGYQGVRLQEHAGLENAGHILLEKTLAAFPPGCLPDLHLHLTVDEAELQRRSIQRDKSALKPTQLAFLERVFQEMNSLCKSTLKTQLIPTSGHSPEQVTEAILQAMLTHANSEWHVPHRGANGQSPLRDSQSPHRTPLPTPSL